VFSDPVEDKIRLRTILMTAAQNRTSLTYVETLNALGYSFNRPRMRALSRMLLAIDAEERASGRPGLAVLVVRQSDRLPGQGWWIKQRDYDGPWAGKAALDHVTEHQARVFTAIQVKATSPACLGVSPPLEPHTNPPPFSKPAPSV